MLEPKYLYRGLRQEEIDAGYRLIAKGVDIFEHPQLPVSLPFRLSEGPAKTVLNHQNEYPTCGVSTTFNIDRARYYAGRDCIVRINRKNARTLGVREYRVSKILRFEDVNKPEDEEIILTLNGVTVFPGELIDMVYKISNLDLVPISDWRKEQP